MLIGNSFYTRTTDQPIQGIIIGRSDTDPIPIRYWDFSDLPIRLIGRYRLIGRLIGVIGKSVVPWVPHRFTKTKFLALQKF